MSDWIARHQDVWQRKDGLRHYYTTQIFDRMLSAMVKGPSLELGAGPGFFAAYHPGIIATDMTGHRGIHATADAHALPFPDTCFANVAGIDVVHHLAQPATALREVARVLRVGGRLILVEPWSGPMASLFYKFVHHEDCYRVDDPWEKPFTGREDIMDGNATIPKTLFHDRVGELADRVPHLHHVKTEPFGCLSYLLTGGFQNWGVSRGAIDRLSAMEAHLPKAINAFVSTRALFILEKK